MRNARSDFLEVKLLAMCGPNRMLVPPKGMGEAAQADTLALLGRALDGVAPTVGYEAWWSRFEIALLGGLTSRAWPAVADVVRAAKEVQVSSKEAAANASLMGAGEAPHIAQMVEDWWKQFRRPGPGSLPRHHHAKPMVDAGLATYGQLWRAGFPLPQWAVEIAKAEQDPDHAAISREIEDMAARLRGQGVHNPAFASSATSQKAGS